MRLKTMTASIAALGFAATAVQAAGAPEAADQAQASSTQAAEARRAVRDKETGKLRAPDEEELKAMLESERNARKARGVAETGPAAPLVLRQHSNGMRSAVLGAEYLVTVKARRAPDGRLELSHDKPSHEHATIPAQRPTE